MNKKVSNVSEVLSFVQDEQMKAFSRVGTSPEDAMVWLLKFGDPQNAQYDLEQLSHADLEKVKFEIWAFVGQGYQIGSYARGFIVSSEYPATMHQGKSLAEPNLPTKKQVQQLQAGVQNAIDVVLNEDRPIEFVLPQIGIHVCRGVNPPRGVFWINAKLMEAFTFKFYQLFSHFLLRLRHCKASDCAKLFLARSGKKQYCSPTCQNRAGVQKFRKNSKNLKKTKPSVHQKKGVSRGEKRRKR